MRSIGCSLWVLLFCSMMQLQAAPLPPQVEAIRTALRVGDAEAATEAADNAVAALPKSADAWYIAAGAYGRMAMQASIFSKLSWAKKSREAYLTAITIDPQHVQAQMDLMQYYLMAPGIAGGGRDKAEAQVARISKLDVAWGHTARATLARVDEDEATYEREARAAIAASPLESRHRVGFVLVLGSKERWDDAFAVLDEGLAKTPEDVRLNYHVGRLAALSGKQLERGLAALEKANAAAEKPDDFSAGGLLWRRALILEKMGRKAEALPELKRAVQLEPALKEQVEKDIARLQKA
jgi:tetratricopeptide (TPR) repeat protein